MVVVVIAFREASAIAVIARIDARLRLQGAVVQARPSLGHARMYAF